MSKREELRSKMLSPFNSRQLRSGSSLPSVLIGVGIMGIVAAGMGQVYKTSFRAQKRVENNQERTRIADSLVQRVDCKKTFAGVTPGTCPGGVNGVIALKDASNNTFVSGSGNASKIGDWAIKASCNSSAGEVSVNIAASKSDVPLVTANGSTLFSKDPLNEQLLDWSHSKSSLFLAGTGLCRSHFSAGSGLCDAGTEGNTRYNSVTKQLEFCNGTSWVRPGGKPDFIIAAQYHAAGSGQTACGTYTPPANNSFAYQATCTRSFNTLLSNTGGYGSLSSGRLVLSSGTYYCHATAVGFQSETFRTALVETSGSGLVFYGDQQHSEDTQWTSISSSLIAQFTINTSRTFELRHWVRNQGLWDAGYNMENWPGYQAILSCMRWD